MRRWLMAAGILALAGCVGEPTGAPVAAGCPLLYPDGAPAPCEPGVHAAGEMLPEAPAPSTSWLCKDDSTADNGRVQQLWMDAGGHLGVRWDWRADPLASPAVAFAVVYQDGNDQALLLPFDRAAGFAAFPAPLRMDAPFEAHILAWSFTLLSNDVDAFQPAHWVPRPDARLIASVTGADPWVSFAVPSGDGVAYVDVNSPDRTEAGAPMWRPRGNVPFLGDVSYVVELEGGGAKFPARDPVQMRANPGFCYLESPPVLPAG